MEHIVQQLYKNIKNEKEAKDLRQVVKHIDSRDAEGNDEECVFLIFVYIST